MSTFWRRKREKHPLTEKKSEKLNASELKERVGDSKAVARKFGLGGYKVGSFG